MKILGIEYGSWSVKAVEIESRWRKFEVIDFHEVRLPLKMENPSLNYKQATDQLLARLPAVPEKIVTSLPMSQTSLRFLQLPIKNRKKVEQMYRFELEDAVPFKLDEAILEHWVVKQRTGSLVFAAIAPENLVKQHLLWLKSLGIDPDWLTFDSQGLINLFLMAQATKTPDVEKPVGPQLLLDIGHQKTNLCIIEQNEIKLVRSIPWGGQTLNNALAVSQSMSLEDAEKFKIETLDILSDNPAQEEPRQAIRQCFQSFTADLTHSLVSFRNTYKQEVTGITLTGGTSKLKGIKALFENAFEIPVSNFNAFDTIPVKEELKKADISRFTECWGRSIVFARKAPILFNFRSGVASKQTSFNEVSTVFSNPAVVKLAQYAAGLAAILFIHVNIASYLSDRELAASNEELRKVFKDTFRSVPSRTSQALLANPDDLKKFIDQKNAELEKKIKMASKTDIPALSIIKSVSNAFPATVRVDVNTLLFDDRSFTLEGVLYEGTLDEVTTHLKNIPQFNEVQLEQQGQRFTYKGKIARR